MAARQKKSVELPELDSFANLYGQRQVRQLETFLHRLRQREREDAHGNRQLFLSDLFVAQLLAFHYPTVRSLRTLDALSCTATAQQMLQVQRLPRSTVSDTNKVVEPALLEPLVNDLAHRLQGRPLSGELGPLVKQLVAVDGTFLRVVGELTWALRQRTDNGRVVSKPRLDVQLDVAAGIPRFAVLSGHTRSECSAARLNVEPGKIYLGDKAYFGFDLLRAWLDGGAHFVVALNSQIKFTPAADQPVGAGDQPADRVRSDRWGRLTGCQYSNPPTQTLREVVIVRDNGQPLRLLTSLCDPAFSPTLIGQLYRCRWQVELFFRWLKTCANFRHVISHSANGLSVALYVALIATLLLALATGRRPSKHTLLSLEFVAAGMAELQDLQPVMERFDRERELARLRRQKRKAAQGRQ
jgi:hypothetical protein